jgi:hypothetical protein
LEKIGSSMERKEETKVLTFVTAIAVLMNSGFIKYDKVYILRDELILSTQQLQQMKILSQTTVVKLNQGPLFTLHHSIPFLISKKTIQKEDKISALEREQFVNKLEREICNRENRYIEEEDELDIEEMCPARRYHILDEATVSTNQMWGIKQVEMVEQLVRNRIERQSFLQRYQQYKKECTTNGIQHNPFHAFK